MTDLNALTRANAARWAKATLTRASEFDPVAKRLAAPGAKVRYQEISSATNVPWFVIAVIHEREASQCWDRQLAQGDPLGHVSTHVPKGRGPFFNHDDDPPLQDAFYRGALDALIDCAPYAAKWTDWSVGGTMTLLEQYNGLGYANRGLPSPYVWSGTNQYSKGKYVADGVFDPNAVDKQLGCAGLIMAMMALDPSISFGAPARPPVDPPPRPIQIAAPKPAPAPSAWGVFVSAILSPFRRT